MLTYGLSFFSFIDIFKDMGGCVSHDRDNNRRRSHSSRSSATSKLILLINFNFVSFLKCHLASGTVARNKPLNRSTCRPKWKSDVPITESQLRRKREEYWDTGEIFVF